MRKAGFLNDKRYLLHDTGPYHPECPERLNAIYRGIEEGGLLSKLTLFSASNSSQELLETVHNIKYIMRFEEEVLMGVPEFDTPDNVICRDTYEIAVLAVGGIIDTVSAVAEGKIDTAFCSVRPPGHHAETGNAMGFCYFNNIAITAKHLQIKYGFQRVAVIDFDVHHGNGTQHIFERDPSVFYYSIHEHPSFAFPGTGREFEKGVEKGEGFTLNSPMLPGQGDREYTAAIERDLLPAMDAFKPDFILVSAGFDAHKEDDMSGIRVTTSWYTWIMERIMELGDLYADGKIMSILEGGYCLKRLPELAKNHVEILMK